MENSCYFSLKYAFKIDNSDFDLINIISVQLSVSANFVITISVYRKLVKCHIGTTLVNALYSHLKNPVSNYNTQVNADIIDIGANIYTDVSTTLVIICRYY